MPISSINNNLYHQGLPKLKENTVRPILLVPIPVLPAAIPLVIPAPATSFTREAINTIFTVVGIGVQLYFLWWMVKDVLSLSALTVSNLTRIYQNLT